MKLNELLQIVEKGTNVKIVKGDRGNITPDMIPNECEVQTIKNGIDCLVVQVQ